MTDEPPQRVTELPAGPARPDDAHKGAFGRVLIIGGSRGMSGAACLSGLGALRGGAGLVYLAVPSGIVATVASVEPSYLTIPLPEDHEGRTSARARPILAEVVPQNSAVAVGPGWGQSDDLLHMARWLYTTCERPLIVDADGLNALARIPGVLETAPNAVPAPAVRILTPHPGEFARLLGSDVPTVESRREELAAEFAKRHGVVLVLKGHRTVITDGGRLAVNGTGNSGMATGGSGDVLTGLIAALVAQGLGGFEAAMLGASLHGLAGDLAARELSQPGLIASDLPRFLPLAWKTFEAQ